VIRTIRCDCGCHPQSVEACACGRAAEMRETIAGLVEGRNGQQPLSAKAVIAQYVAQQGEQIRISPAAVGFNLVAWLGPLIGLVLGLAVAITLVRHLARSVDGRITEGRVETVPPVDPDDPYRAKLRQQLKEWD
jgi:cytochrome c-type biogenesis protein CcmH